MSREEGGVGGVSSVTDEMNIPLDLEGADQR